MQNANFRSRVDAAAEESSTHGRTTVNYLKSFSSPSYKSKFSGTSSTKDLSPSPSSRNTSFRRDIMIHLCNTRAVVPIREILVDANCFLPRGCHILALRHRDLLSNSKPFGPATMVASGSFGTHPIHPSTPFHHPTDVGETSITFPISTEVRRALLTAKDLSQVTLSTARGDLLSCG